MAVALTLVTILSGLMTAMGANLPSAGLYQLEDMACLKGSWNLEDGEGDIYARLSASLENNVGEVNMLRISSVAADGSTVVNWTSDYYTTIFVPSYSTCKVEISSKHIKNEESSAEFPLIGVETTYSCSESCPATECKEICSRFSAFYRLSLKCDSVTGAFYNAAIGDDPLEKLKSYQRIGRTLFGELSEPEACMETSGSHSGQQIGIVLRQISSRN